MEDQSLIAIDRVEDQVLDHPDANTKREINETSLDETFQSKLKAMADQIRSNQSCEGDCEVNYQFLISKFHLNYHYTDSDDLATELSEWFTYTDLTDVINLNDMREDITECELLEDIDLLNEFDTIDGTELLTSVLKHFIYCSFGEFNPNSTNLVQLQKIKLNNDYLIAKCLFSPLIKLLSSFLLKISNKKLNPPFGKETQDNYFRVLSLLYFMVNVLIKRSSNQFLLDLDKSNLLSIIFKFTEFWKWNPNKHHRIRNLILLTWKLLLFEFGDSSKLSSCDDYLNNIYNIKNDKYLNKLVCSPLDYYTFQEDLKDKYPLYNTLSNSFDFTPFHKPTTTLKPEKTPLEENYNYFMAMNDFSQSLSNLIESPKTNKSHTIMGQLPSQTVHIATPVPSPNLLASDYLTGGEKIRRSYQVNQSMPFIYPNAKGEPLEVPYALKQADEILSHSIHETYSTKRLWNERQKFMIQERGNSKQYQNNEKEFDQINKQTRSLQRVEKVYETILPYLHSFVAVILEVMKSNKHDYNLNYAELELNPNTSCFKDNGAKSEIDLILMRQLEVINTKEITLKAGSAIILLLSKWFKRSHVLKFYYLTSILYDQNFCTESLDFINKSFNNSNLRNDTISTEYEVLINQNKLMNPKIELPLFDFFNNALKQFPSNHEHKFINRTYIMNLPTVQDDNNIKNIYINKYNLNFTFILSNLLAVNNKILIPNQIQRIFSFNDLKCSELYKLILLNYNCPSLTRPILKTLKKLIPYQGRKWKSTNMDLISQVYLNLKLSLKDNWLSGKDLETDFNIAYDQEIALRSLIQFYNMRNYANQMEKVGYKLTDEVDVPAFDLNDGNSSLFKGCLQ